MGLWGREPKKIKNKTKQKKKNMIASSFSNQIVSGLYDYRLNYPCLLLIGTPIYIYCGGERSGNPNLCIC